MYNWIDYSALLNILFIVLYCFILCSIQVLYFSYSLSVEGEKLLRLSLLIIKCTHLQMSTLCTYLLFCKRRKAHRYRNASCLTIMYGHTVRGHLKKKSKVELTQNVVCLGEYLYQYRLVECFFRSKIPFEQIRTVAAILNNSPCVASATHTTFCGLVGCWVINILYYTMTR